MTSTSFPHSLTNLAEKSTDIAAEYHSLLGQSLLSNDVLCFYLSYLCHSSLYSPLLLSPCTHNPNPDLWKLLTRMIKGIQTVFLLPSLLLASKGYLESVVLSL